jgi:uncharacterized protein (TIGR03545 family)
MGRALRWQFAVPWVVLLIVVVAVGQVVLARLVRTAVEQRGAESVGAKVDVGETQVSLPRSRVTLRQLAVANPQAPLRNLVEIDFCDLHFDADALLRKQAVIDRGALTGIRFGTSRKVSGLLPNSADDAAETVGWFDEKSAAAAEAWLDRLHEKFSTDLVGQLESIRLTEELLTRWPNRHTTLEARVHKLRERAANFHATVREARTNPLRHAAFLESVPDEIARIRKDVAKLSATVEKLPSAIEDERRAIVAARQHDEQFLQERLQFDRIDSNVLTAYLLQEQLTGPLADVVGWLRWMRQLVPAEPRPVAGIHRRGEDLLFADCQSSPDLLIRSLDLRGTAQIGGRQLELLGTVTDFASQPRLHNQPLRVRLTTNGAMPIELQASIDRTGRVARDQVFVNCGGIVLPKLRLGGSDKLRLTLEPSSAVLNVSILLEGDRLSGDIQLVQSQVQVVPSVAEELSRAGVPAALDESLDRIGSLATRVSLHGSLDAPHCQVWSNIGPAVAEAMDLALARAARSYSKQLLAESQRSVDERLAELDRQIADQQSTLLPQLATSHGVTAALAGDEDRPLRLTPEQLGRRLPADSLFR